MDKCHNQQDLEELVNTCRTQLVIQEQQRLSADSRITIILGKYYFN